MHQMRWLANLKCAASAVVRNELFMAAVKKRKNLSIAFHGATIIGLNHLGEHCKLDISIIHSATVFVYGSPYCL